jgi:hypothetical protein
MFHETWPSPQEARAESLALRALVIERLRECHVPWLLARLSLGRFFHFDWQPVGTSPLEGPLEYVAAVALSEGLLGQRGRVDPIVATEVDDAVERIWTLAALQMGGRSTDSVRAMDEANVIRGEATVTHLDDTFLGLFDGLTSWVEEVVGAAPSGIVAVVDAVRTLIVQRIEHSFEDLLSITEETVQYALYAHPMAAKRLGLNHAKLHQLANELDGPALRLWCCWALAGEALADWFVITAREVADAAGLDAPVCGRVLAFFTPDRGALFSSRSNWLDTTEIERKPLLPLGGGRFFCPLIKSLRRAPLRCLEHELLRNADQRLLDRFQTRRGRWLEEKTEEVLQRLVPDGSYYSSLKYRMPEDPTKWAETDGVAVLGRHAFVFECKAGNLAPASRAGDPNRLESDLRKNIGEAWRQGSRVVRHLRKHRLAPFVLRSTGKEISVDTSDVEHYHIVNPTLGQFGGLVLGRYRALANEFEGEGHLPWSVYINDLRTISAICPTASMFVDYVHKRTLHDNATRIVTTDELDVFMFYLNSLFLFDFGDASLVVLDQFTDPIDRCTDAFVSDEELRKHVQPDVPIEVLGVLRDLDRVREPLAQDLAVLLLGASQDARDKLAAMLRHASARAVQLPDGFSACGMRIGDAGLAFWASAGAERHRTAFQNYVTQKQTELRVTRIWGVARDMNVLGGSWVSDLCFFGEHRPQYTSPA